MNTTAAAIAAALTFTWLGMVFRDLLPRGAAEVPRARRDDSDRALGISVLAR